MSLLDRVIVKTPCQAPWESMKGNDRVRFCRACGLDVHNLSSMSRREAERFVREAEGRVCVRFFRREDGRPITRRRGAAFVGRIAAALALALASATLGTGCRTEHGILRGSRLRQVPAIGRFLEWIDPTPVRVVEGRMGKMVLTK